MQTCPICKCLTVRPCEDVSHMRHCEALRQQDREYWETAHNRPPRDRDYLPNRKAA
jgi:hypothetical protein